MSFTDKTGVWPNRDECCASITNAKKAVRLEASFSIQRCQVRSSFSADRLVV
jgi:hypothetical protein